jgi:hypothetical protein
MLLGMEHDLGERLKLSLKQQQNVLDGTRGAPPFAVRRVQEISDDLNDNAIVKGFLRTPIYTLINNSVKEDFIRYEGCPWAAKIGGERWVNASNYNIFYDYYRLIYEVKKPLKEEFGLSQEKLDNMNFVEAYELIDVVNSKKFEGIPLNHNWTDLEWEFS